MPNPANTPAAKPVLSAAQVRQQFIDFFVARGHRFVPSSPVFPKDDATLLFTNAGMNQFKDVFLGTGTRDYRRAVNSQKCIRVSGKHNDLEEVGLDTYHHTFFEMLGNWSFGDYFKREAIHWSWELLTKTWGLPKDRLWVTVFGGDEKDGLPVDEEAASLWRETDIDPTHILRFGRKDNFWEMGETGPCGPCTEIHIDRGGPDSNPLDGADRKIGVNAGNERFIELWNNVFMEFNRQDDGRLVKLPAQHVDTGMGFERVLSVLQGKRSNYDTDLFTPIFRRLEQLTGASYGADESRDIAFRVIADHMRAVCVAIADGASPSNEGRGYVLRRLLRRAARFGRQALGVDRPFLFEVVPTVVEVLGKAFPELAQREKHIQLVVRAEEDSFGATLERGLGWFADLVARTQKKNPSGRTLPGAEAFELYATYGFPQDLVEQMLRERNWELDRAGWDKAQSLHRSASRSEGAFKQLLSAEQLSGLPPTRSTFYEPGDAGCRASTRVARLFKAPAPGAKDALVLEASPFYAESGGQVGDAGLIKSADGRFEFTVEDTKKLGEIVVHVGGAKGEIAPESQVVAEVDAGRRAATRANHTATHLLHKALKEVLGEHVGQQGSYVGPDRLRFDFSSPQAVTPEQLERIEQYVNREIARNASVDTTVEDLEAAKGRGVVAMFGEKYADRVRVVSVGEYSAELCGGTHVRAAGDIGTFLIVQERALSAGVRRIEAVTRENALLRAQELRRQLQGAARLLKTAPEELGSRIEQLQQQLKDARKKEAAGAGVDVGSALELVRGALKLRQGISAAVVDLPDLDGEGLRSLGERVKTLAPDLALALFARSDGKIPFLVVCEGKALAMGLHAGQTATALAKVLGGGGGGRPNTAQGQGLNPAALGEATALAGRWLSEKLGD
ncbi:MAG TPA: alanine--tRNA ligase [Planctomycetota bacterium]|nr:alanine--tRNA ligase [Planctomycetota bacterium]